MNQPSASRLFDHHTLNRRQALRRIGLSVGGMVAMNQGLPSEPQPVFNSGAPPFLKKREFSMDSSDHLFLEEIEKGAFQFFWDNAHPRTGLVKDRSAAVGEDERTLCSIAATGFGLTALCIGASRGYRNGKEIRERARTTLQFLWYQMHHNHGFYYHFVDASTGRRQWGCELSSIDTAILLCGVVMCGEYFVDPEIRDLASLIYNRVDWNWMMNEGTTLSHGWKPESGFLEHRWDHYSELMMLYLLALGSDHHRVSKGCWAAWNRPVYDYFGLRYIGCPAPLFVHQYSHAWFDFHGIRDRFANYFDNSVLATEAHRRFCLSLKDRYPHFSGDLWGITASDSINGYVVWGGPPEMGPIDGTVVPCASAGSLPFLFDETMAVLRNLKQQGGERVWNRYGFADAYNPATGWVAEDVIGINQGITLLMVENIRSGFVWDTFMKNDAVKRGLERAHFKKAQAMRPQTFKVGG